MTAAPHRVQIAGMLGVGTGNVRTVLVSGTLLAGGVVQPGWFGGEFRLLALYPGGRHGDGTGSGCAVWAGLEYRTWAVIALLPLNFAGLALVHARVLRRGRAQDG